MKSKSRPPLVFDKRLVFIIVILTMLQFLHLADSLQPDFGHGGVELEPTLIRHKRGWLPALKGSPFSGRRFGFKIKGTASIGRNEATANIEQQVVINAVTFIDPDTPVTAQNRQTIVQMKLRLSTILRDNIVNVFGYMLNQPSILQHLDLHLYASLVDLYNGFRMRRIRTPELLYKLPVLAYESPANQFKLIFQTINITKSPQYLTAAVNNWLTSLTSNHINIDEIIRPDGGALVVDFLADIDHSLLEFLKHPSKFTPESERAAPKYVTKFMGPVFGNIMGSLIVGSLVLTQTLLALIMLHTQLYQFIPEVDEAQRYLADVFYEQRSELDFVVQDLTNADKLDHYTLIRIVLTRLALARGAVDPYVQECAETILPHFLPVSTITYNPNIRIMSPIISNPVINLELLFQHVALGEYPQDIVRAKDTLVTAIWRGELDMVGILKGFVKYDYTSPNELMIAILDRIRRRSLPPPYLQPLINALITHLKLKYNALTMDGKPMEAFMDVEALFTSFFTPDVPDATKEAITILLSNLKQENLDWKIILDNFPPNRNSRPRMLAKNILMYLAEWQSFKSTSVTARIVTLLDMLDDNADPMNCPRQECPSGSKQTSNRLPSTPRYPPPPPPPPPPRPENIQDQPTELDISSIMQAIPIRNARDQKNVQIILDYLEEKRTKVSSLLESNNYKTIGSLLRAIFVMLLADPETKIDINICTLLKEYSSKIAIDGIGANSIAFVEHVVTSTVDMNSVIQAFDKQQINGNTKLLASFNVFYAFLANDFRSDMHLGSFQFMHFKTSGEFLTGLCHHLKSLANVRQTTKNAISDLEPYILLKGVGALPVELTSSKDAVP